MVIFINGYWIAILTNDTVKDFDKQCQYVELRADLEKTIFRTQRGGSNLDIINTVDIQKTEWIES